MHCDPLELGHFLHREATSLAAVSAILNATKWYMRFIGHGAVVEMNHARFKPEGQIEHLLHIVRGEQQATLKPGDIGFIDTARPYEVIFPRRSGRTF